MALDAAFGIGAGGAMVLRREVAREGEATGGGPP